MEKLLIVDDSSEIRKQLKWGLGKAYKVSLAESVDEALKLFAQHQPSVVTLDLGLPPDIIRGFVLIGRTAGLVAHIAEENREPIGLPLWLEIEGRG